MISSSLSPSALFEFYKLAEKLKLTLRHSWLSDGQRRESVAEHTWMMSLLALAITPHLEIKLDTLKVLKMIIIHDLAEATTTDLPIWEGQANKAAKHAAETKAINQIFGQLDEATAQNLLAIWQEYEDRTSIEAKFVKIIDTLDVVTQHNTAPIETWDDNDFLWQLSAIQNAFFDLDPFLRKVKDELDAWSIQKVSAAKALDKLDQAELAKRQEKKNS